MRLQRHAQQAAYIHMHIWVFGGFPWGLQRAFIWLWFIILIYSKSYNAILYGQVSHDCTVSQSLRMVQNEIRKHHYINHWGLQAAKHVMTCQDM